MCLPGFMTGGSFWMANSIWHNHLAQSPARGCRCHSGTLAGAGGTKVCIHPSAQARPSPWGGSMQLFAHTEHPCSAPGLARGHREAAAKAEYLLSPQNKLVHEDAAVAHAVTRCATRAGPGHGCRPGTLTHTGHNGAGGTRGRCCTPSDPGQADSCAQP